LLSLLDFLLLEEQTKHPRKGEIKTVMTLKDKRHHEIMGSFTTGPSG